MSSVLTYKVEIKNNQFNTELCKYSSDWMKVYCKIQRQVWHRIKQLYMKYGSIDLKMMNSLTSELRSNYDLTARCLDAIVNNMIGRYEALKELKKTETELKAMANPASSGLSTKPRPENTPAAIGIPMRL